jgi:tRNA-2-methylthio-N6-dimethylallyladenosine synthase
MHYSIWTIGCQMNKADSGRVEAALQALGLAPAPAADAADLVILNTCVVRGNAEDRAVGKLGALKGWKRQSPGRLIAVMGCLVPPDRRELSARFPYVDLFFTIQDLPSLTAMVSSRLGQPTAAEAAAHQGGMLGVQARRPETAVAKYVPIIYGCDNFCTYCIVPYRRGREVSRPPDAILGEVSEWVRQGAREVTLLGQNVDAYAGRSPANAEATDLAGLLRLVHEVPGLDRIRFLTSHPRDMSVRLLETMASLPRVCPAINLPVQAGHDDILTAMRRGYSVSDYRALAERIRRILPGVALTTDLIVGFPGESDAQFQASLDLLSDLRFDMVHVAAYSPRAGTRAALMEDDVPAEEKARRLQAVESMQTRIVGEINAALLGSGVEVLVEGRHRGKWTGRTATDKIVFFEDSADWLGTLIRVEVIQSGPWSLQGRIAGGTGPSRPACHEGRQESPFGV